MEAEQPQGQAPEGGQQESTGTQPGAAPAPKMFDEKYVEELRGEAGKWRTQLRDTQARIKELEAALGDNAEMSKKLQALQAELEEKAQAAERATREAQIARLAARAGVDPEVAALLDPARLDLTDEKKALETLGKLAGAGRPPQAQARPGGIGGMTEDELKRRYWGGQTSTIFGG